jgi:hypothetical protein
MATGQGTATIDFGALPGSNEASVVVADVGVGATSKAEAFIMGDDTSTDHSAVDHRYVACLMGLTIGTPSAGTGFTVYGRSTEQLVGKFALRYIWAD